MVISLTRTEYPIEAGLGALGTINFMNEDCAICARDDLSRSKDLYTPEEQGFHDNRSIPTRERHQARNGNHTCEKDADANRGANAIASDAFDTWDQRN